MQIEHLKDNGLLLISHSIHTINLVTISLYFRGGPAYESLKDSGISHLMEHMFFRSLAGLSQKELYRKLRRIGTMMYGVTNTDYMKFEISTLKENLREAFNILNLILAKQNWTLKDINAEKKVVLRQIDEKGSPNFDDVAYKLGYQCHPWGALIMGTSSSVNRISRKKLLHWQERVCAPANACFAISGCYDINDFEYLKQELSKHSSIVKPFAPFQVLPQKVFHRSNKDIKILDMDYEESDVSISFDVPKNERNMAEYFYNIMSGVGSELSIALREKFAFTTEINVYVYHHNLFSRLFFDFSVDNRLLLPCLEQFFTTLIRTIHELTEYDVSVARESERRFFLHILERPEEFCDEIPWKLFISNMDIKSSFQNITLNKLKESALKIFKSNNLFVAISNNSSICKKTDIRTIIKKSRDAF